MSANLEALVKVIPHLNRVGIAYAFLGGAVVELLITEFPMVSIRPTKDVDAIIVATTYGKFALIEEQLRKCNFHHDTSEGAPICRWIIDGIKVDLMPTEESVLNMKSRWFKESIETAIDIPMEGGLVAKVVAAPYFLATKLEAFRDRGRSDFIMSTDLEDIIAVVNGRPELATEIAQVAPNLRQYLINAFKELLNTPDFVEAIYSHLPLDQSNQERLKIVSQRLEAIARL
jgi:predicted nucleotidyltransferase